MYRITPAGGYTNICLHGLGLLIWRPGPHASDGPQPTRQQVLRRSPANNCCNKSCEQLLLQVLRCSCGSFLQLLLRVPAATAVYGKALFVHVFASILFFFGRGLCDDSACSCHGCLRVCPRMPLDADFSRKPGEAETDMKAVFFFPWPCFSYFFLFSFFSGGLLS